MEVRAVLRATDQFVALACAHISFYRNNNRCLSTEHADFSPPTMLAVCHLASMPLALLEEFGKRWIMSVESTRACTISASPTETEQQDGQPKMRAIQLWVSVSPTLGVVRCGAFQCRPECGTMMCAFGAGNAFLMTGYPLLFVVDGSGKHVRTLHTHSKNPPKLVGVNAKWLVVTTGDYVHLWNLVDGCLTEEHHEVIVQPGLNIMGKCSATCTGGNLSPFELDKAALCLSTYYRYQRAGTGVEHQVLLVDLNTSFTSRKVVEDDEARDIPPQPHGSMWIKNTLHTLHRTVGEGMRHVFNTETKLMVHTFQETTFLNNVGPYHLCCVDRMDEVMSVFHSSDLTHPCCVHHLPVPMFPGKFYPLNCGIVPVARTTPTRTTTTHPTSPDSNPGLSLELCDTVTGILLAHFSAPHFLSW
ncbi:hypothetical protein Pelo_926 [Pelomyxa schiedti]|nr:hypothetical protein Pelo_926 [Pelomyxa schiedti]